MLVRVDGRARHQRHPRADRGLDRFHGAKVIYSLFSAGLITVSEPTIENIGLGLSVAVRGPIDLYNEIFLNTLTDSNTVKQLRVEIIDDKEVEIPVIAGQVALGPVEVAAEGEVARRPVLVFTAASTAPQARRARLAGESTAWVLLASANDQHSLARHVAP